MQRNWLQKGVCRKAAQQKIDILDLCTSYLIAKDTQKQMLSEGKGWDFSRDLILLSILQVDSSFQKEKHQHYKKLFVLDK